MRENRLYGSMRGGARKQRKLATAAGSIPHALARLLYLRFVRDEFYKYVAPTALQRRYRIYLQLSVLRLI